MPEGGLTDEERARLRYLEQQNAARGERENVERNVGQRDVSLATVLTKLDARVESMAAAMAAPKQSDMPGWLKIGGPLLGAIVAIAIIVGMISSYGRSSAEVIARIAAMEAWKIDMAPIPSKVQELSTGIDMAKRVRDQQAQGMSDRLVGLEQSDRSDREALNRVLQQLATITAQLQALSAQQAELLRRQDRLENRLGARPGNSAPDETPTALVLPLRWRVPVF